MFGARSSRKKKNIQKVALEMCANSEEQQNTKQH